MAAVDSQVLRNLCVSPFYRQTKWRYSVFRSRIHVGIHHMCYWRLLAIWQKESTYKDLCYGQAPRVCRRV